MRLLILAVSLCCSSSASCAKCYLAKLNVSYVSLSRSTCFLRNIFLSKKLWSQNFFGKHHVIPMRLFCGRFLSLRVFESWVDVDVDVDVNCFEEDLNR